MLTADLDPARRDDARQFRARFTRNAFYCRKPPQQPAPRSPAICPPCWPCGDQPRRGNRRALYLRQPRRIPADVALGRGRRCVDWPDGAAENRRGFVPAPCLSRRCCTPDLAWAVCPRDRGTAAQPDSCKRSQAKSNGSDWPIRSHHGSGDVAADLLACPLGRRCASRQAEIGQLDSGRARR